MWIGFYRVAVFCAKRKILNLTEKDDSGLTEFSLASSSVKLRGMYILKCYDFFLYGHNLNNYFCKVHKAKELSYDVLAEWDEF